MPVRIAILGASGGVGSALTAHLLRSGLLQPADTLQQVGHGIDGHVGRLLATRIDLQDAFSDNHVDIELVADIGDVRADIVVAASGATLSERMPTRRDIAQANSHLFRHVAEECAARLPASLFIIVSNPVELAVDSLSRVVDRHHVVGMGAQQDSLRFARAIASDLGVSRHDVLATVVGEHGAAMAPLWQGAALVEHAQGRPGLMLELERLRASATSGSLPQRVAALRATVQSLLENEPGEE